MYVKILGKDRAVLYINIEDNPTMSVYYSDEEDCWMSTIVKDGVALILHSGEMSDCHAIVNTIMQRLELDPESINCLLQP
jgi:hypothetical protein